MDAVTGAVQGGERMSRWIKSTFGGGALITIVDMDQCKHMYNEVCYNDKSSLYGDYPDLEYDCQYCELFEKENGVIE